MVATQTRQLLACIVAAIFGTAVLAYSAKTGIIWAGVMGAAVIVSFAILAPNKKPQAITR